MYWTLIKCIKEFQEKKTYRLQSILNDSVSIKEHNMHMTYNFVFLLNYSCSQTVNSNMFLKVLTTLNTNITSQF